MKTPLPIEMLEDVSAEIIENTSLLEVIYRTADMDPEVDNSVACLIRSMQKTLEKAHGYIEMLASNPAPQNRERMRAILQMMFLMLWLRLKNSKSLRIYILKITSQMPTVTTRPVIWPLLYMTTR